MTQICISDKKVQTKEVVDWRTDGCGAEAAAAVRRIWSKCYMTSEAVFKTHTAPQSGPALHQSERQKWEMHLSDALKGKVQ